MLNRWTRARVRLRRARRWRLEAPNAGRLATFATCLAAGLMMSAGAIAANGADLRPSRTTDLIGLVQAEADRNAQLTARVAALRADVARLTDNLSATDPLADPLSGQLEDLQNQTGLAGVKGPGITVTLSDAPLSVKPAGVADELLIVHQQDIQAVANALWAAGAEAMTIQGQRVTALTGIKCVGNTVVLHGVPYAPPYVITAIGDQEALEIGLASDAYLSNYRDYANAYLLGYAQDRVAEVTMPAYAGGLDLQHAEVSR